MNDDATTQGNPSRRDSRQDRLAARLRENLRKRKDQARRRDAGRGDDGGGAPEDNGGGDA